jgi:predicted Zn-dependent peptidase
MYHDPDHLNTDLAKYQAVTAKQVKDVLNKYLNGKKKVLIEYLPEANKEAAKPPEIEEPSPSDETP